MSGRLFDGLDSARVLSINFAAAVRTGTTESGNAPKRFETIILKQLKSVSHLDIAPDSI